jgi:hypothetical protein
VWAVFNFRRTFVLIALGDFLSINGIAAGLDSLVQNID